MKRKATRQTPLGSSAPPLLRWKKHVAYRTENGALYGRPSRRDGYRGVFVGPAEGR
jgi:hypothetical protein